MPQDIPAAHYFLEQIDQPMIILLIRVLLGLTAFIFAAAYIRIKTNNRKKDEGKK
jgi:hypothetical protein